MQKQRRPAGSPISTVYAAEYNPCCHESGYAVIPPLHTTRVGAYRAMRAHKLETWEECEGVRWKSQAWRIKKYKGVTS